jgi:hypothetical protein
MSREEIDHLVNKLAQKVKTMTNVCADDLDRKDVKIVMIHLLLE